MISSIKSQCTSCSAYLERFLVWSCGKLVCFPSTQILQTFGSDNFVLILIPSTTDGNFLSQISMRSERSAVALWLQNLSTYSCFLFSSAIATTVSFFSMIPLPFSKVPQNTLFSRFHTDNKVCSRTGTSKTSLTVFATLIFTACCSDLIFFSGVFLSRVQSSSWVSLVWVAKLKADSSFFSFCELMAAFADFDWRFLSNFFLQYARLCPRRPQLWHLKSYFCPPLLVMNPVEYDCVVNALDGSIALVFSYLNHVCWLLRQEVDS